MTGAGAACWCAAGVGPWRGTGRQARRRGARPPQEPLGLPQDLYVSDTTATSSNMFEKMLQCVTVVRSTMTVDVATPTSHPVLHPVAQLVPPPAKHGVQREAKGRAKHFFIRGRAHGRYNMTAFGQYNNFTAYGNVTGE